MPKHDIIAIGASAGGVEALQKLISGLPENLPAAVFVVMHLSPRMRSYLPEIFTRAGNLSAIQAEDNMPIQPGRIYVAPPDYHLLIERGHVHVSLGPKEQHKRPSINVTFRSAALAYGDTVVGVVLTGEMDDGTAGLWDIKRRGGVAVVQTPEEAVFPSMPLSALREIEVDYAVNLAEMSGLLCRLAFDDGRQKRPSQQVTDMEPRLTDLTCPDCRGTIWEVPRGTSSEYRCRVGHTYSPKTMLAEHFSTQEKALYSAVVAMEEGASLAKRLVDKFDPQFREQLLEEARSREKEAETLKELLESRRSFSIE
ncbi:MAG: chemotaxis protein CheB [Acidobacteriia bacterium]|nr:chemotaxis protein CheB [Terriglobia bacterium]MBV9743342.1 chemotaxis protein CheB [Terriglobia bacterium]